MSGVLTRVSVLVVAALAIGCLRPAEQRAQLDSEVGVASAAGVDFRVRDGLAAVREVGDGRLVLWAQSPVLDIDVSSSGAATQSWSISVLNSMPGSTMTPSDSDVVVSSRAGGPPKSSEFDVVLPLGRKAVLHVAAPDEGSTAPFSFAVLGDIQGAVGEIGDIYGIMNQDPSLRFVASPGDLTEQGTSQQLDRILQSFDELSIPFYSTVGNHELGGDPIEWHARFGRASFHWVYRGVHLSFVDSANAGIDPLVYDWLRQWLEQGSSSCHLLVTHFPPIDPVGTRAGSFRDRNEAAMLIGMLVQGRADSTFHGHIHSFYEYSLGGIPAYISGGGGAIPERMDGIGRHYLRVTVDPTSQQVDVAVQRVD